MNPRGSSVEASIDTTMMGDSAFLSTEREGYFGRLAEKHWSPIEFVEFVMRSFVSGLLVS